LQKYPINEQIVGEQVQKEFIKLYGGILKVKNILSAFDEFTGNEILTERDVQDYHSMYINLYNEFRGKNKGDSENVNDDIVFEMELIKQVEINIDYILELIRKYHEGHLQDKEIVITISKAIDSSVELRNKKDLIKQFVASLTSEASIDNDWQKFVSQKQKEELSRIIIDENLKKKRKSLSKMLSAMDLFPKQARQSQNCCRRRHSIHLHSIINMQAKKQALSKD
jgi:type I restriction enzyme R subunit